MQTIKMEKKFKLKLVKVNIDIISELINNDSIVDMIISKSKQTVFIPVTLGSTLTNYDIYTKTSNKINDNFIWRYHSTISPDKIELYLNILNS